MKAISKFVSKDIKDNKLKVLFNTMHGVTSECIHLLAKNYNLKKYDVLNENIDFFKILYDHTLKEDPNDILNLSSNHKEGETWASIEADKIYKKMFSE